MTFDEIRVHLEAYGYWSLARPTPQRPHVVRRNNYIESAERRQWRRKFVTSLMAQKRFHDLEGWLEALSAEWSVVRISDTGETVSLQCPHCQAVTFFNRLSLVTKYSVGEEKQTRPYIKCGHCDFQPYLPLDLKSRSTIMVILSAEGKMSIFSPVFTDNPDEVQFNRYGPPANIIHATRSQTQQEDNHETE